nr:NADH dehydrogenase (quinone) subunit D [Patulibacter medicamentivorans]
MSDETPKPGGDPAAPAAGEAAGPSHREQDAPATAGERQAAPDIADLLGGEPGGPLTAVADPPADQSGPSAYRVQEQSIDFSAQLRQVATRDDAELLTINMGPHHPATHGVLRLLTTLEGEVVRDVKPIVGYLHTGIEKTAEDKAYWKAIPVIERMDYLAYYFNAMAYVGAVEDLLEVEVPKRAQYLRVIHLELNRIMSHLVWLGTTMLDLGAISIFWYAFRERETILDLFEYSSGQRMHTRYFQIGGVAEDIPAGWEQSLRRFLVEMPKRIDQYDAMLKRNEIVLRRLRHVGVLSAEQLQAWGVTGPLLRAAGVPWDLRKAMPSSSYEDFDFQIPVGTEGDNYDRYLVRVAEMRQSLRIIEQAIDGLPEGPWITEDRKVALPPRHELATSMEALIHHFKLVTEGMRVPAGEAYHAIEGPRGELGCFVRSDGSSKPARVHVRDPSFVNLQAFGDMARGEYIADMIATLACLDPLLGGIDR